MRPKKAAVSWDRVKEWIYKKERIPPEGTLHEAAAEYLEKAASLVSPKVISIKKVVRGPLGLGGKKLSSYIDRAESVHLFLVTIGDTIENTATRSMEEGDSLGGYLLDRIGSFAVESLAENYEESLRDHYTAKGLSVSSRFSPGYCDWPLEEQFKLAKLVKFSKAGVELTESCMMVPKKSISGLIAVGPKGLFPSKRRSPCHLCDLKNCGYRR